MTFAITFLKAASSATEFKQFLEFQNSIINRYIAQIENTKVTNPKSMAKFKKLKDLFTDIRQENQQLNISEPETEKEAERIDVFKRSR